jgi:hypothetical protein
MVHELEPEMLFCFGSHEVKSTGRREGEEGKEEGDGTGIRDTKDKRETREHA